MYSKLVTKVIRGMSRKKAVDRYGFFLAKRTMSDIERKLQKEDEREEPEKEARWIHLLKNWQSSKCKARNQIAELVKRGIPETLRGVVWAKILDTESISPEINFRDLFEATGNLPFTETVDKDLDRSLPQIQEFWSKTTLEKLQHVLYAYGSYDKSLGYTQGMNFICGLLLHYQDEETAFKSFVQIMQGPRIFQREYFLRGFPRLALAGKMLKLLIAKKYPKILKNFERHDIVFELFSPGWFMTAFMAFNWDPEFQMRIFERFVFFGTRALLGFALAIFSRHKYILQEGKGLENILPVLQKPDESPYMQDWHYVIKKWDDHWVSKSEYQRLLKSAGAPPEVMM